MLVLKPMVSSTLSNLCIFSNFFSPYALFKDNKHTTLLIQKCILVQKAFSLYKKYILLHQSLKEPCLQRFVNSSYQAFIIVANFRCVAKLLFGHIELIRAIGGSFNSLEFVVDYGVADGVVSFKFVISFFEFVITSFEYGEELSSSTSHLVIDLADTRTSNSLL